MSTITITLTVMLHTQFELAIIKRCSYFNNAVAAEEDDNEYDGDDGTFTK